MRVVRALGVRYECGAYSMCACVVFTVFVCCLCLWCVGVCKKSVCACVIYRWCVYIVCVRLVCSAPVVCVLSVFFVVCAVCSVMYVPKRVMSAWCVFFGVGCIVCGSNVTGNKSGLPPCNSAEGLTYLTKTLWNVAALGRFCPACCMNID